MYKMVIVNGQEAYKEDIEGSRWFFWQSQGWKGKRGADMENVLDALPYELVSREYVDSRRKFFEEQKELRRQARKRWWRSLSEEDKDFLADIYDDESWWASGGLWDKASPKELDEYARWLESQTKDFEPYQPEDFDR